MINLFKWISGRGNKGWDPKADELYRKMHDKSTGVYNEYGLSMLYKDSDHSHIIIIEIEPSDYMNMTNSIRQDTIKKLVDTVKRTFRSVDYVCRIDENIIAVIMTRADSSLETVVMSKINQIKQGYREPLTIGIAYGDKVKPGEDVLECADKAFFKARMKGRYACEVYGTED